MYIAVRDLAQQLVQRNLPHPTLPRAPKSQRDVRDALLVVAVPGTHQENFPKKPRGEANTLLHTSKETEGK